MLVNTPHPDFLGGEILLLDKPYEWTSFDLVNKLRNLISKHLKVKKLKVGHTGTLDPLATGLMIICTGKATKQINELTGLDKEYVATLKLGETTPSFDLESEVDNTFAIDHISKELIEKMLLEFMGETDQVPPAFSAKYVNGKRAYEYARKGREVELKPSRILISEMQLIEYNLPFITLKVRCSKGTYIRALARDLGEKLNCGAHLTGLKRTAIGDFSINDALTLEKFQENLLFL
ncbi:MAG: tRNA pseudouridine(55) synthase TruB [Bacteroidales bacterium]|nr:tRNA pseudouridine(55) synthase TruB [Bacteroidales bacterium]